MKSDQATKDLPGFDTPVGLPTDAPPATEWQAANRAFWEATPMRYDWRDRIAPAELFPLPGGKVKTALMAAAPNGMSRFFANALRFGHFLVAKMTVIKAPQ
jgi:hypothetical protein